MPVDQVRMIEAADGLPLALHDLGGEGESALLLHGITANARSLDGVVDDLSDRLHLYALDFRGRGLSGSPLHGATIPEHALDAAAAIAALRGRVQLIGHSLGALVALYMTAERPDLVDRLVLIDGAGDVPPANLQAIGPSLARLEIRYLDFAHYEATFRAAPHLQPWNSYVEAFCALDALTLPDGGVRSRIDPQIIRDELVANASLPTLRTAQARIQRPTLIMRAALPVAAGLPPVFDRTTCLEAHEVIKDSLLVELPQHHHYSIALQPSGLRRAALRDFLAAGG
jgi:pimeloyl-ACP methyl ester carboxylesterase